MGIQFHVYRPNPLESSKMTLEQANVSLLLAARLGAVITKEGMGPWTASKDGGTHCYEYRNFGQLAWVLSVGESGDSGFVFGFVKCKYYPDQTSVS